MKTLLIVDVQNDFMPYGALPVAKGDEVVPYINQIIASYDLVVATQDWHPENHKSFAAEHDGRNPFDVIDLNGIQQVLWPRHCVQATEGAEFHPDLNTKPIEVIFRKGMNPEVDSYSAFFDNDKKYATQLSGFLKAKGVKEIDVVGLAADYCVFYSVQDALNEGFRVNLHLKGTRAIDPKNFEENILKELTQNPNFKTIS
ncbi:bifunctional nicotinamidase/pyrazinamidase [Ornithobacterium rhinotracheale]|uniref:bifunctional nicotinamidase/pyrazinamidase n=1 Tax=Ornithobacterium rhinotracheale TaxID=28251 RepID=UPI001FF6DCB5|nr:bifunctional nicotinamidase/pyrazinamidase [Ornithobacterium rhinotracheale]MCK0203269.1 bifunctional nicotinamidase/pyrazinamidase [Ornithobacterium rhinotracheale]